MISFYKDTSFGLTSIPLGMQAVYQLPPHLPYKLHLGQGLP